MRSAYIADGLVAGGYTSKRYGSSIEFADHKQYTPGDETRHIDWKLNARTDRYFVRRFEDESNRHFQFLIDCSGSMAFAGQGSPWSKWQCAATIAFSLATVCLGNGDAAGWGVHNDQDIQWNDPTRMSDALVRFEEVLLSANPHGHSNLIGCLEMSLIRLRRRSCIVILGDLLDEPAVLEPLLNRIVHSGHQAILLQIMDSEELHFNRPSGGKFIDLEDGGSLFVDPIAVRNTYLKLLNAHHQQLSQIADRLNANVGRCKLATIDTSEPLLEKLVIALDQSGVKR